MGKVLIKFLLQTKKPSCYNSAKTGIGIGGILLSYIRVTPDGVVLSVRVQPRSSKDELAGSAGDCLKVRVNAPPVEGAANEACERFLAKLFGIAKGRVRIISGLKSRQKQVLLEGLDEESVLSRVSDLLQESK